MSEKSRAILHSSVQPGRTGHELHEFIPEPGKTHYRWISLSAPRLRAPRGARRANFRAEKPLIEAAAKAPFGEVAVHHNGGMGAFSLRHSIISCISWEIIERIVTLLGLRPAAEVPR